MVRKVSWVMWQLSDCTFPAVRTSGVQPRPQFRSIWDQDFVLFAVGRRQADRDIPRIKRALKTRMKAGVTFAVIAIALIAYWYTHRAIHYPPGVLINGEPAQVSLPETTVPIPYGSFSLKPLALFSVDARVLHRRNYRYDAGAALVPVDLALGWGPMSNETVLDKLSISQSMRFYWYQYRLPPPIPATDIVTHSANMHIIPATPAVEARCKSLRAGSLVHLIGDLVEASGPGIGHWRSSLSRSDTGNGACELFYVEEITEILPSQAPENRTRPTLAGGC